MEGSASAGDNGPFPSFPVASLLGFKGALRLIPHGSEQKPHLVLRRADIIDDTNESAQTKRVARFSFFARKRIEVKPGKEIMFCVASGDDENAPFKDMPVVFEGDIIEACQTEGEKENEKPLAVDDVVRKVRNMEGLPPKMRKSITKAGAFNDFYFKESSSSFGFPGLPLHCAAPRVYSSTAVQTEAATHTPSSEGIQVDASRQATPLSLNKTIPIHLPSPVSADNGGLDSDSPLLLAQGVSQIDFIERSLSPMELSSTNDTPRSSPISSCQPLPDQPLPSLLNIASRASSIASSTYTSPVQPLIPTVSSPQNSDAFLGPRMVIDQPPKVTQESGSTPKDLPSQVVPVSPDAAKHPGSQHPLASPSKPAFLVSAREASIEIIGESQPPETASTKPGVNGKAPSVSATKMSPLTEARFSEMQNAVASSSKVLLDGLKQVERLVLPSQSPRSNKEGNPESPSSTSTQRVPPLAPISTSSSSTWRISPPPEQKSTPYIPAGTSANPLGIRPSSHLLPNQKMVPKGPRSLVGNSTAAPIPTGPKKPVVVGAKWSASMRTSSSTTSSSLSSIPSSSSLSAAPVPTRPTDLSKIISYGTPSPPPLPPPPSSEPPPPPPPAEPLNQPETSKWKRIDGKGLSIKGAPSALIELQSVPRSEKAKQQEMNSPPPLAISPSTLKNASSQAAGPFSPTAPTGLTPVKRTLSSTSSAAGSTKQASKLLEEPPLKKCRTNDDSTPPPSSTTSKSQLSTPRAPSIQRTTVPQPLNHPLPPKPVAVGSSYRPSVKRERPVSPEVPEPKRPATATDWPATICSMQHRLQGSSKDLSVQKIAFNGDGAQFALICADRTLRIWESKNPPAELARLSHNSPIVAVSWTWDDAGVITLGEDGLISMWARVGNEWKFSKVQMVPSPDTSKDRKDEMSLTCSRDRIAVAIPNFGVRVWINISGTWQQQREIARSGVTAIRFVEGGDALVGGCRDGAVWYCEVPNGTLRAHAFTAKAIASLDVSPTGSHLLVGHEGGKALLVNFRPGDGTTERTYTSEKLQAQRGKFFAPVFATKGQAILHGVINSCALVWDRKKGAIVYGLKHPGDDPVTAAATFDGRPGVDGWMITGTKQGRLLWWPQPVAAAPSQSEDTQRKRQKVTS